MITLAHHWDCMEFDEVEVCQSFSWFDCKYSCSDLWFLGVSDQEALYIKARASR